MSRLAKAVAGALVFSGAAMGAEPPPLLLSGGHVLKEDASGWREGVEVLIEGDRIAAVAPAGEIKAPEGAKRIDVTGMYVMPGLIDLHTHLLLHPYNETKWDDQVLKEPLELRTVRAVPAARATLLAGFTTIRDLGTEGAGFADVGIRDAVRKGIVPGPRVFASTRAIVATGCYGPSELDPRWQSPKGAQEADGPADVRKAVREQIAAGADWVKLYADYRRAPGDAATPTFSEQELRAAVEEAHTAGKPCAAHATTDAGARRAVEAGFDTIEHGYGLSRETLELMKEKGTVLVPTMAAAEAVALYAGWHPESGKVPAGVAASRESVRRAHEVGVTIAFGTDAGVFPHGQNARELELMVAAGLTPTEAVRAATVTAAKVLRAEGKLGVIREGAFGDVVAVRGDVLADVGRAGDVAVVISRGRVEREPGSESSPIRP
jgi:imidazolonepropionase-like amidohydrolase